MYEQWRRPAAVPFPRVWTRFNGLRAMADGRVPAFWIQDVRAEDETAVLALLEQHFLREEDMSRCLRLREDGASLGEMRMLWRRLLEQRMALAAWTAWPDAAPRIIAVNVTAVTTRGEPFYTGETPIVQKIHRALNYLFHQVDIFQHFGVDAYLGSMGLSVLPAFRGQGVGLELLRARAPLCRATGLTLTATIFTGVASQKQAERAGFDLLAEKAYTEYMEDGQVPFRVYTTPSFQLRAMRIKPIE